MDFLIVFAYICIFVFGLIIGSFLNVVIFRQGTGMGLGGRSRCAVTGRVLAWYELVPVLSYILQKGRARGTSCRLSIQYPLVEITTGLLFVFAGSYAVPLALSGALLGAVVTFVFFALVVSFGILVFTYDLRHMIIPNSFSYPFIVLSVVSLFFTTHPLTLEIASLGHFLAGPIFFAFFALIWKFSQGRAMGFADAKLALAIGWLAGLDQGIVAILLAFFIGALVGVVLLSLGRAGRKTMIPFGPFLLTGLLLTFLYTIPSVTSLFQSLLFL